MSYNYLPPWNYESLANSQAKQICTNPDGNFDYWEENILRYEIVRLILVITYYKDFYKFHS